MKKRTVQQIYSTLTELILDSVSATFFAGIANNLSIAASRTCARLKMDFVGMCIWLIEPIT